MNIFIIPSLIQDNMTLLSLMLPHARLKNSMAKGWTWVLCGGLTFENFGYEMEVKVKNKINPHVCLTLGNLISRLVTLLLGTIIYFQLQSETMVCKIKSFTSNWNQTVLTKNKGTNLETKLLEVRHISRPKFFYLWLTNLHFETNIFECMLPPHEGPTLKPSSSRLNTC